jgi:hypothetical protein
MVKQAELEQSNLRFSIEQSNAFESRAMEWMNQIYQRRLDASKTTTDVGLKQFEATMEKSKLLVGTASDLFKSVFELWIRLEIGIMTALNVSANTGASINKGTHLSTSESVSSSTSISISQ